MGMGLRIPLHIYQVTSGQALCSKTRLLFYRMQGFWVYKMAVPLGLGALPQETPVNGQKKICSLQDACPRFIWKLQAMSFCELVSYRMVCLEVSPNCMPPTFPGNFRIFFSQSPKLRQRKGLIIPFLIGPLSGVFPFPHTSMMESQKIWRGMPGSWPRLRFHIGFWH